MSSLNYWDLKINSVGATWAFIQREKERGTRSLFYGVDFSPKGYQFSHHTDMIPSDIFLGLISLKGAAKSFRWGTF